MKNLNILQKITAIIAVFNNRNFFSTMNKCKNMAKLFICAFAIAGLTACASSGSDDRGSGASNNGGADGITLTSANSIITDDKIDSSGDNSIFVLRFTDDVSADEFTIDDFTTIGTNIDIIDIIKVAVDGLIIDATIEFEFIEGNTAAADITIDAGKIGNAHETNDEDIVIFIDKDPRVLSKTGNNQTEFNSDIIGNEISYTFNFSEAIHGLEESAFVITPADSGVSINRLSFNDGTKEATATFTVAENTNGIFSIGISDDSYTDEEGNGNREKTEEAVLPLNITIDTIAPTINSTLSNYNMATSTLTLEFSEELNLTNASVLTSDETILENATIISTTIENSDGKRKVIAVLNIDISKTQAVITISGDSYSDIVGNVGEIDYTLTIDIEALVSGWLTNGNCQNFFFDGGTGSNGDPYQISNVCQLQNIDADDITIYGVAYTNLLTKNYKLIAGIDASYTVEWNDGAGFNPIGDYTDRFAGTFDGSGFTLSNLTIDRAADYIGLFGYNRGTIKDITLDSVDITGNDRVGGIAGRNNNLGTIDNSSSSGSVNGGDDVGGLAGNNTGTINNSSSSINVVGTGTIIGGFVGFNNIGTIDNSSSSGSVSGTNNVGGFVGLNNSGIILSSSSSGSVVGSGRDIGGFVGEYLVSLNFGKIENSHSSGSVSGNRNVGGFVGSNNSGTILSSRSSGSVVGSGDDVGGFVGRRNDDSYSDNKWCKPAGSTHLETGNNGGEDIDGIDTVNPDCSSP